MAQTYTGNVNLAFNAVDNVSGLTIFNHAVTNGVNPSCIFTMLNTIQVSTTTTVYGTGSTGAAVGVYVKNLVPTTSSDAVLTVNWDNGQGLTQTALLHNGEFIIAFSPNPPPGRIKQVTFVPSIAALPVEFAIWA